MTLRQTIRRLTIRRPTIRRLTIPRLTIPRLTIPRRTTRLEMILRTTTAGLEREAATAAGTFSPPAKTEPRTEMTTR